MKKDLEMAKFKVPAPLFDTTETQAAIERDQAKIAETTTQAEVSAREKYATPAPAATGAAFIPKAEEQKPVGAIVSSLAKIGGDVGGPQTDALDVARQQLQAQQQTAQNTAKLLDKMSRPSNNSVPQVVYA